MIEQLKKILNKVLPDTDVSGITEDTLLKEELGFDSLSTMMLAMEIEDAFGFRFTEFVVFKTVGEVCSYIESHK